MNFRNTAGIILVAVTILCCCNSIKAQAYDHVAFYHKIVKEFHWKADGSLEYHFYKKLEFNNTTALLEDYHESFIDYNPRYQELVINKAVTTTAEGDRIEASGESIRELVAPRARYAKEFRHLKRITVTHAGLDSGSVLELDYTVRSKAGFHPLLMHREILLMEAPVKRKVIKVMLPGDDTLYHKVERMRTAPDISEDGSKKIYTWTFGNLKAYSSEPFMPHQYQWLPLLEFATGNPAETVTSAIAKAAPADTGKPFNQVMKPVDEMLNLGNSAGGEDINSIYQFVLHKMDHYYIPPEDYGFRARNLSAVLQSGGGTPLELALLMQKMLEYGGYNAQVLYACTNSGEDYDTPLLFPAFPYVKIDYGGNTFILNPVDETRFDPRIRFPKLVLYPLKSDKVLPAVKDDHNHHYRIDISLKMDPYGKIKGDAEITLKGGVNPFYDFFLHNETAIENLAEELGLDFIDPFINDTPDSTFIKAKVDAGSLQSYLGMKAFRFRDYSYSVKNYDMDDLRPNRRIPLDVNFRLKEEILIEMEISEFFNLVSKEMSDSAENEAGKVALELKHLDDKLEYSKTIQFKKTIVSGKEYHAMRELIERYNGDPAREILFRDIE